MAKKKKKKKKYHAFWVFAKVQLVLFLVVLGAAGYYFFGGYASEVGELKTEAERLVKNSTSDTFRGHQTSVVYAADGSVISTLKESRDAYYLESDDIPSDAKAAIVSIEDKKFYRHDGVDYWALLRAVKAMVENGKITQGGSTITMQLARNVFISQERTWQRKVEEIFIARSMEQKYTKDQILEFYLNNIYFGNGYYGIESASRGYFNRGAEELSLSQIAFLCAIPNNPTLYDPVTNMDNTIARRDRILSNMQEDGKISAVDYADAIMEQIALERPAAEQKNDYVETYAYYCATRALMEQQGFVFQYEFDSDEDEEEYDTAYDEMYTACQKQLYTGGYQIYTSLDLMLQEELQGAVDDTLAGFTEKNEEGVYMLQASAVCIDNDNGYVKAIVGGRTQDFAGYTLNRAYQSYRQPGSAIKPLTVYTPLFERNYSPESMTVDEPIEDGPKNSNGTYLGEVTLRVAIEKSINTVAWRMYEQLTPEVGLSYLEKMHFARLDPEDYRLASSLGGFTNGVSSLEMASAYAAIANDGLFRQPTCIVKILDASENEIYASTQQEQEVYKQNAARMMTDVLRGVFVNGTARGLGLETMPCAGKTGTTNDQKDGWMVGYTRYYTTSVWVGYDMPQKLNDLMGNTYPGKIWQNFMEQAHEGKEILDFLPYAKISQEYMLPQGNEEAGEGTQEGWDEEGVFEENPAGMPEAPEATPENPSGTPENPSGTPENPSGTPENPSGTPENPAGTPENPSGTPEDPAGTPENPPGTPEDLTQENAG